MLSFPYAFEPLTQKANPRQLLRTHHAKSMKTKSRMLRINDSRQHDIPKNQNMKSSYKINMTAATLIAAGSFASVQQQSLGTTMAGRVTTNGAPRLTGILLHPRLPTT